MTPDKRSLDRRRLLQMAAAGSAGLAATALPVAGAVAHGVPSEVAPHVLGQPAPALTADLNTRHHRRDADRLGRHLTGTGMLA